MSHEPPLDKCGGYEAYAECINELEKNSWESSYRYQVERMGQDREAFNVAVRILKDRAEAAEARCERLVEAVKELRDHKESDLGIRLWAKAVLAQAAEDVSITQSPCACRPICTAKCQTNRIAIEAAQAFANELVDFNGWETHPHIGIKFRQLKEALAQAAEKGGAGEVGS